MYRIAFFGSDAFSLASLKAVHNLQIVRPELIKSLLVTTRLLKPSGRGMKNIRRPPIVEFAEKHGLPWHEVESRNDFEKLTDASNLAIAVSYGKLIPAIYLQGLTFGGLNVHPSLLPQYKGAAPIQRAIIDQKTHTGVSVQTLHPTKFDHGEVLWQSSPVPLASRESTPSLTTKLADLGAQGLVEVLSRGAHALQNYDAVDTSHITPSRAPIIDRDEFKIDFGHSALSIDARGRALEKLWFEQRVEQKKTKSGKLKGHPLLRVNLSEFVPVISTETPLESTPIGAIVRGRSPSNQPILALRVSDGFLGATEVTVAGSKKESASEYFSQVENRGLKDTIVK